MSYIIPQGRNKSSFCRWREPRSRETESSSQHHRLGSEDRSDDFTALAWLTTLSLSPGQAASHPHLLAKRCCEAQKWGHTYKIVQRTPAHQLISHRDVTDPERGREWKILWPLATPESCPRSSPFLRRRIALGQPIPPKVGSKEFSLLEPKVVS